MIFEGTKKLNFFWSRVDTSREVYTRYKTAATSEEREKARQEYLEKVGIPENFRW